MSPVYASRRRAEEFERLVEDPSTGLDDPRYAHLLAAVGALRSAPVPQARPAFVADLRSRLVTAAESELVAAPAPSRLEIRRPTAPRTRHERRLAVAVGAFAVVTASGSMAVAAQSSLPGDTLYPLKRAIENVHTGLSRGADDKGATMLANARGRLDEVDALSRDGDRDPGVIAQTLLDFADQASEASDLLLDDYAATGDSASIDEVREFTAAGMAALQELEGVVPEAAQGALGEAADTLAGIDRLAVDACPTCRDLPLVQSAIDTVSAIGAGFEDAFAAPTVVPPTTDVGPGRGPRPDPPGTTGEPADVDPTTPPPTSGPTPTPGPGDQGGDDGGGEGGGSGRGPLSGVTEPVDDLTEDLLGDGQGDGGAVGDLLTGTVDTLDGLLGGGAGSGSGSGSGSGTGGGLLGGG